MKNSNQAGKSRYNPEVHRGDHNIGNVIVFSTKSLELDQMTTKIISGLFFNNIQCDGKISAKMCSK